MAAINLRDVPEALRRDFKAVCAKTGITMRERLLQLMEEEVAKAARKR